MRRSNMETSQIAVFNFTSRGEWYASAEHVPAQEGVCPFAGIVGDAAGVPKVACPLHKKTFSLATGESLQGEEYQIRTFPVRIDGDDVFLELPPTVLLDRELATEIGCRLATSCETTPCDSPETAAQESASVEPACTVQDDTP